MNEYHPWPPPISPYARGLDPSCAYDEWDYAIPGYSPDGVYYTGADRFQAGVDIPTWQQVEQFARDTAHQYLPQVDAEKAKRYAHEFKQAASKAVPSAPSFALPRIPDVRFAPTVNLPNIGDPGAWFGQTPQKVSDAADAASRAADAATLAAKEHEETMRIVKYAVIGVGALGGLALLWSIVK